MCDGLSDYEKARLENIRKNKEVLRQLGLEGANLPRPAPQARPVRARPAQQAVQEGIAVQARRSERLRNPTEKYTPVYLSVDRKRKDSSGAAPAQSFPVQSFLGVSATWWQQSTQKGGDPLYKFEVPEEAKCVKTVRPRCIECDSWNVKAIGAGTRIPELDTSVYKYKCNSCRVQWDQVPMLVSQCVTETEARAEEAAAKGAEAERAAESEAEDEVVEVQAASSKTGDDVRHTQDRPTFPPECTSAAEETDRTPAYTHAEADAAVGLIHKEDFHPGPHSFEAESERRGRRDTWIPRVTLVCKYFS